MKLYRMLLMTLVLWLVTFMASHGADISDDTNFDQEMIQIRALINEFEREEAYGLLLELKEVVSYEERPQLYMDVLGLLVATEEYYWLIAPLSSHTVELYQLAQARGDQAYIMESLKVLSMLDTYNYNNGGALDKLQELISIESNSGSGLYMPDYYKGMADLEVDKYDLELAKELLFRAFDVMDEANNMTRVKLNKAVEVYMSLALVAGLEGDYVKALDYSKKAVTLVDEKDLETLIKVQLKVTDYALYGQAYEEAKAAFAVVTDLYPQGSETFYKTYTQQMVNIREADLAFFQYDYKRAATLYHEISMDGYDQEGLDANLISTETLSAFEEDLVSEQLSLYESLKASQAKVINLYQAGLMTLILLVGIGISVLVYVLRKRRELEIVVTTDQLTSISNRHQIMAAYEALKAGNHCIALLDIDGLKEINRTYGHLFGDCVIAKIATTIHGSLRANDQVGRYGGTEFLIVFDTKVIEEACQITERILQNINGINWRHENLKTSASIGVVYSTDIEGDALLEVADRMLLMSKAQGKNQYNYQCV